MKREYEEGKKHGFRRSQVASEKRGIGDHVYPGLVPREVWGPFKHEGERGLKWGKVGEN